MRSLARVAGLIVAFGLAGRSSANAQSAQLSLAVQYDVSPPLTKLIQQALPPSAELELAVPAPRVIPLQKLRCRSPMHFSRTTEPSGGYGIRRLTTHISSKFSLRNLNAGRGRYSPPEMVKTEREVLMGSPDKDFISTSYVERQNLSVRMECKRFARLTLAF